MAGNLISAVAPKLNQVGDCEPRGKKERKRAFNTHTRAHTHTRAQLKCTTASHYQQLAVPALKEINKVVPHFSSLVLRANRNASPGIRNKISENTSGGTPLGLRPQVVMLRRVDSLGALLNFHERISRDGNKRVACTMSHWKE